MALVTERATDAPATLERQLSFAQERLWFIEQLLHGRATYALPSAWRLSGALDVDALRHSVAEVVRRHEALRTTFKVRDGVPFQVIGSEQPVRVVAESTTEADVAAVIADELLQPFALDRGPLMRMRLLQTAPRDFVLLAVLHHIVGDAWSFSVLWSEISRLYGAFARGLPSPLPPLPMQYGEFAERQRAEASDDRFAADLAYWLQELRDVAPNLTLPLDRPRSHEGVGRGDRERIALPSALVDRLCAVGRRTGSTLYMVLLAAFQLLIGRYAGQRTLVVGAPFAERINHETETLIGLFVNTLPLRADLDPFESFDTLLAQTRERVLRAVAHRRVPFERIVAELKLQRSFNRHPLVQVMFGFQNTPDIELQLDGVTTTHLNIDCTAPRLDMTFTVLPDQDTLNGYIDYDADLWDRVSIKRLLCHYQALLTDIADDSGKALDALSCWHAGERDELLAKGRGDCDQPSVLSMFAAWVKATPAARAIVCGDRALTYAALDARADQVARALTRMGVTAEAPVAICVARDVEFIVAVLGVMKAGAAYVPLDPGHPRERLARLIGDCGAVAVVATTATRTRIPDGTECVCVDELLDEPTTSVPHTIRPQQTAYVIFTSGSTGQPKGVAVEHRQLAAYVTAVEGALAFPPGPAALVSTPTADLGHTVLFPTLCGGRTLHVLSEHAVTDRAAWQRYVEDHQIATVKITPSHLSALWDGSCGSAGLPGGLLILGGEPSTWAWVRQIQGARPGCRVANHYGPTEATVGAVTFTFPAGGDGVGAVPLGRPLPHARAYVCDDDGALLPTGIPGELYIGGAAVARGYVREPRLTAERFVPDPFAAEPGRRLYRTGDRARWRADGTLEFLGRLDSQIKLRGFRVEPREVEDVLRRHPTVSDAVVVPNGEGDALRLVAYVIGSEVEPLADSLRSFAAGHLPDHMVPSDVVVLQSFPLTSNGKVDRAALPPPRGQDTSGEVSAPRTPIEIMLCDLWAGALGSPVGIDDDFFARGGNSLLATKIIAQVKSILGLQLDVSMVFDAPTIREWAAGLVPSTDTPIEPRRSSVADIPLSSAQQGLWYLEQIAPGRSTYNQRLVWRLRGPLDVGALREAFDSIIGRHEVLRTAFRTRDGIPYQVIGNAAALNLEPESLPATEDLTATILQEIRRPFDLERAAPIRVRLLETGPSEHILILVIHHIVSDAWSLGLLCRELADLYAAGTGGMRPPLPPLPVQYADFAIWQRAYLADEPFAADVAYWKSVLRGIPTETVFPSDFPRPPRRGDAGARELVAIPEALIAKLRGIGHRAGATLYMVLLTAFQVLVGRYSGQDTLVVGSPIAGRLRPEVESLIGLFVNILAIRADLAGDPRFDVLLGTMRDYLLRAYVHQNVPFEGLIAQLPRSRDGSGSALTQVAFNLQNVPARPLQLRHLQVERIDIPSVSPKMDIAMILREHPSGVSGRLEYDTDLYRQDTIQTFARRYLQLLEAIASAPANRLSQFALQ